MTIALMVFLVSSVISVGVFAALHQQARLRNADPLQAFGSVAPLLLTFAVGCAALTAGGVGLWSILVTHRLCGPVFVMERYLRELKNGHLPTLRGLRKHDELKELYRTLGDAVESLRGRAKAELAIVCDALELVRNGVSAGEDGKRQCLLLLTPQLEKLRLDFVGLLNDEVKKSEPLSSFVPESRPRPVLSVDL